MASLNDSDTIEFFKPKGQAAKLPCIYLWMLAIGSFPFWQPSKLADPLRDIQMLPVLPFTCIVLTIAPWFLRDFWYLIRGMPACRINSSGIWLSAISDWGWLRFDDIESTSLVTLKDGSQKLLMQLKDSDKYVSQSGPVWRTVRQTLRIITKCSAPMYGIANTEKGLAAPSWIGVMFSRDLGADWDKFKATLEPLLAAHNIPMSETTEEASQEAAPAPNQARP